MRVDHACFGDRHARDVVDVRHGEAAVAALDRTGFWAVVVTFEGAVTAVRFADLRPGPSPDRAAPRWTAVGSTWSSSLGHTAYVSGVEEVRRRIAAGEVYQVNLCRVLTAPLLPDADLDALHALVRRGNPAPYAARIRCDEAGLDVVSASPELFLAVEEGRLVTRPIKGTAATAEAMLPKDRAENVMIVDLVRNDLSAVCEPGTVSVDELCAQESHPGLVHLVSTVGGRLRAGMSWRDILAATTPAGSVSGAPKSSALRAIRDLEPVPRGPYCGAVGWVDADRQEARLAVGIRTFWAERAADGRRVLRLGTGAGITWHSDPEGEWAETQLKAARLVGLASGRVVP